MTLLALPYEIVSHIFLYLTIQDLARLERTCKNFQSWILCEIERRIKTCTLHDDWDILIHSGSVVVTPARFDIRTKKVFYSVPMDPIRIKTMYAHRRQIHCALSWSCNNDNGNSNSNSNGKKRHWTYDGLQIVLEEGMKEGITEQIDVQGENGCELHASLTRLQQKQQEQYRQQYQQQYQQLRQRDDDDQSDRENAPLISSSIAPTNSVTRIAPLPLIYSIQVDELSLPLSKLICVDAWPMYEDAKQQ
ncbi:hypothetical protein BCR42DRAFT_412211 [Absidia repens]|uniref:F-box domain-containing protein n=1 Tax=Absidia repens TaxID=90262 RepID=A0A1X2IJD5_9FUNG|nr:hypothetical protein BCR42DRAFT_412211 [Absidia repens]